MPLNALLDRAAVQARRLGPRWLLALLGMVAGNAASAQSCYVQGALGLNFGSISASASTDTSSTVSYTCQSNAAPTYFRLCLNVPGGSPSADLNPRLMTNYVGAYLQYNIYADAARTQIIGPQGGGYTEDTWTLAVPGSGGYAAATGDITIYGRVASGQGALPSGSYQSQINGIVLRYAWSSSAPPADCQGGSSLNLGFSGAYAQVPSGCRITAINDLDFGTVALLASVADQAASLSLQCPNGTSWQVGMGNGSHYSGGRYMANGTGARVAYGLYRDAARTQAWGSTLNGDTAAGVSNGSATTLPIYGRVPSQASQPPGSYSDTVVVTLTY